MTEAIDPVRGRNVPDRLKSIRSGSQHVVRPLAADLAVWKLLTSLECPNRGAPDVSQYEAPYALSACALRRLENRAMTSHSAPEPDRASPASRVGEHQVYAAGPAGNSENPGCPGRRTSAPAQEISPGRVAGVRDRVRDDRQPVGFIRLYGRLKTLSRSEPTDLGDEFSPQVGDEPGGQWGFRLGLRAAVEHHVAGGVEDQQARGRVLRGSHCPTPSSFNLRASVVIGSGPHAAVLP